MCLYIKHTWNYSLYPCDAKPSLQLPGCGRQAPLYPTFQWQGMLSLTAPFFHLCLRAASTTALAEKKRLAQTWLFVETCWTSISFSFNEGLSIGYWSPWFRGGWCHPQQSHKPQQQTQTGHCHLPVSDTVSKALAIAKHSVCSQGNFQVLQ